jgi:MFS family permease
VTASAESLPGMSAAALTAPRATHRTAPSTAAWLGLAVVVASAVMDLLDSTIAQTAAPAIRRDFGRRRVLLGGMTGFVVVSALCALAPSSGALIAGRAVQGVLAAVMVPQGFGLIRELFGDAGQQKAFAVFGPVMGLAAVAGPVVGGALVDAANWRAIFLVNVPLGVAAIVAGRRFLPRTAPATPGVRVDALSVALTVGGGVALVYPLIQGREQGWPAWSFAMLAAGVLAVIAFVVRQARRSRAGRTPLVEPSILRRRPYVAGLAVVVGFIGAMGGMTLALNVMFQVGLGFSPLACGVATVAIPLAAIAGSITSSAVLARIGRRTMHIGIAVMAGGLVAADLVLRSAGGGISAWQLAPALAGTGFGMGMVFVPMFDVILAGVRPHELGSASGLLESVQQLAMSLGIAATGTALFDRLGTAHGAAAFAGATDHALLLAVAFLAAAWAAVFWLPRHAAA